MHYYSLTLIFLLLVCSCVTKSNYPSKSPSQVFDVYVEAVKRNNNQLALSQLSKTVYQGIVEDTTPETIDKEFQSVAYFHRLLVKKVSEFEKFQSDNQACLNINGYNAKQEPMLFNIEFVKEMDQWKLDYIDVEYLFEASDFLTKPSCPIRD